MLFEPQSSNVLVSRDQKILELVRKINLRNAEIKHLEGRIKSYKNYTESLKFKIAIPLNPPKKETARMSFGKINLKPNAYEIAKEEILPHKINSQGMNLYEIVKGHLWISSSSSSEDCEELLMDN